METTKKELELRPSTCGEICELDKSQLEQLKNWVQELIDKKASPSPSTSNKQQGEFKVVKYLSPHLDGVGWDLISPDGSQVAFSTIKKPLEELCTTLNKYRELEQENVSAMPVKPSKVWELVKSLEESELPKAVSELNEARATLLVNFSKSAREGAAYKGFIDAEASELTNTPLIGLLLPVFDRFGNECTFLRAEIERAKVTVERLEKEKFDLAASWGNDAVKQRAEIERLERKKNNLHGAFTSYARWSRKKRAEQQQEIERLTAGIRALVTERVIQVNDWKHQLEGVRALHSRDMLERSIAESEQIIQHLKFLLSPPLPEQLESEQDYKVVCGLPSERCPKCSPDTYGNFRIDGTIEGEYTCIKCGYVHEIKFYRYESEVLPEQQQTETERENKE
jgi:hypothetical protein